MLAGLVPAGHSIATTTSPREWQTNYTNYWGNHLILAAHWRSAANSSRKMVQRERRTSSSRSFPECQTAPRNSPMLLVIDAGNTNITVAVCREVDLIVQWRLITEATRTSDEYGVQMRNLFELAGIDFKAIDAIVIASVVPSDRKST